MHYILCCQLWTWSNKDICKSLILWLSSCFYSNLPYLGFTALLILLILRNNILKFFVSPVMLIWTVFIWYTIFLNAARCTVQGTPNVALLQLDENGRISLCFWLALFLYIYPSTLFDLKQKYGFCFYQLVICCIMLSSTCSNWIKFVISNSTSTSLSKFMKTSNPVLQCIFLCCHQ